MIRKGSMGRRSRCMRGRWRSARRRWGRSIPIRPLRWTIWQYFRAIMVSHRRLRSWIRERVLGPEHPDTAASLNNLAVLYGSQGQYGKAEPLYARALAIREKALGPEHPDTAIVRDSLAILWADSGKPSQAQDFDPGRF